MHQSKRRSKQTEERARMDRSGSEMDLNLTLQQLSAKNERIRSRLKSQGIEGDKTKPRDDFDSTSRLSYGAFSTQDFLSSTRLSIVPPTKQTSSTKKVKVTKKIKKKMHEAIQFSSEDEEMESMLGSQPPPKRTMGKPPKGSSKQKEGTPSREPNIRNPLTPRPVTDNPVNQQSATRKVLKKKTKVCPTGSSTKKKTDQKKDSEESVFPETSTSSHALSSSMSSLASAASTSQTSISSKKSSVKKKQPPKKKAAFLQAIQFSSDSENSGAESQKVDVAQLKKLRNLLSSRSSANTSSDSNASRNAPEKNLKSNAKGGTSLRMFVMDSDSEVASAEGDSPRVIVPDSQSQVPESEESIDEAFVTLPCSQDDSEVGTHANKGGSESDLENVIIPDSQEAVRVLVPDTEDVESCSSYVQDVSDDVVPCSQNGDPRSQASSGKASEQHVTVIRAQEKSSQKKMHRSLFTDSEVGESEESEKSLRNPVVLVPDSEAVQSDESVRSVDETNVCIPDSEAVQSDESIRSVEETNVCIPDSEAVQSDESIRSVDETNICIPDSEAVDSNETNQSVHSEDQGQSEVIHDSIAVIECSHIETTPENQPPDIQPDSVTYSNTPSLVSRLVSLVKSVSSSPVHLLFGTSPKVQGGKAKPTEASTSGKPMSAKKLDKLFSEASTSKQGAKETPSGSKRRNFFDIINYSSEEESEKDNAKKDKSSSDVSSVHDSSSQSQIDSSNISELSVRLQNILSKSTKKKKPIKVKTKKSTSKKPGTKKGKEATRSDLEDSSFERMSKSKERNVLAPDSESCRSWPSRTSDDISVIEDSQVNVLASNTESVETDSDVVKAPEITIPDSQETMHLQLSLTRSEASSFMPSQDNTVRHITPILTKFSRKLASQPASAMTDEYSMEIPYCGPQGGNPYTNLQEESTDEFSLNRSGEEEVQKKTAEISLQVSMMSPGEQSDEPLDADDSMDMVSQREISLQVSMVSPNSPEDDLSPSPNVASFCTQVSIPESPDEDNAQRVSYDGTSFQDRPEDISTEVPGVARRLQKDIEEEEDLIDDGSIDKGNEPCSDEDSSDDAPAYCNTSLQVSMCIQGRSPVSRRSHIHAQMEESIMDIGSDDEQPSPRQDSHKNVQNFDEDSDVLLDDSDEDPDFQPSKKKTDMQPLPKGKGPTQRSTSKTRRKNKSGSKSGEENENPQRSISKTRKKNKSGSKSGEEKENLTEAQAIKTVLLCEKKENVAGMAADMEDDFTLPDLSPPRINTGAYRQPPSDSSDDDFDAYLESLRTPKPRKVQARMDDFIDDDDDSSGDDDDGSPTFYSRTDRQLETGGRDRPQPKDSVFKTPSHLPSRRVEITPQPGTSRGNVKTFSKTPVPARVQQLSHSVKEVRCNSTGHLPQFEGFLKSLSTDVQDKQRHPEAKRYVKDFKKQKDNLTQKLFKMYNETVFESKLPEDLPIKFNCRLTTTAGYCAYKRDKSAANQRVTRIDLSGKVCDSAERVRDTLIHELCHAAVWVIYGKNDGHGRYWQSFVRKAQLAHADLPPISRCHTYDIHHKFVYKCNKCGQQVGRHTKSLNTEKKVCGICHGKFEVHLNTPKGLTPHTPRTPRTLNKFALFVKDNYNLVKQRNTGFKHADVMKALSADFANKAKVAD